MAKKTADAEKIEALKLVALERMSAALARIETAVNAPVKTRWYEASWVTPHDRDMSPAGARRHRVAIEAFDADEARHTLRTELVSYRFLIQDLDVMPGASVLTGLPDFHLRPLAENQCRYCCMTNWSEDGDRCSDCGRTSEDALRERRMGRFDCTARGVY